MYFHHNGCNCDINLWGSWWLTFCFHKVLMRDILLVYAFLIADFFNLTRRTAIFKIFSLNVVIPYYYSLVFKTSSWLGSLLFTFRGRFCNTRIYTGVYFWFLRQGHSLFWFQLFLHISTHSRYSLVSLFWFPMFRWYWLLKAWSIFSD